MLAVTANVSASAAASGVDRTTAYTHRRDDPEFAAEWAEALESATDDLEAEARRRAMDSSDTLMIFLLKAHRPDKYREKVHAEITGKDGGPVELSNAKAALLRGVVPDAAE